MALYIYILAGIAFFGTLLMVLPFEFNITCLIEDENDIFSLQFFICPFFRCQLKAIKIDLRASFFHSVLRYRLETAGKGVRYEGSAIKHFSPGDLRGFISLFPLWSSLAKSLFPPMRYLSSKTELARLTWETGLGTGDPCHTGLAAAFLWSLKGFLVSSSCRLIKAVQPPKIAVTPDFSRAILHTSFGCILRTRTGYIIFTGVKMIVALLASGKTGQIARLMRKTARRNKKCPNIR